LIFSPQKYTVLIKIYGSAIHGVAAQTIAIEVNVDTGEVGYHLIGPPRSGKTILAKRVPGILPPFTLIEIQETSCFFLLDL
jgi:predicted ATPase with chaperone activity